MTIQAAEPNSTPSAVSWARIVARTAADAVSRPAGSRSSGSQPKCSVSRAEFAAGIGTFASRLSTYLGGTVTPVALLVRTRRVG